MTKISIVVAMNKENVIGVDNQLPWHIPEDLQHFKQITYGKPIIMGRKTFESIGRVLPGRKNIVISRNGELNIPEVTVYTSLAIAILDNQTVPELCIIGGGEIFKQALPIADELYLTIVDYPVENPTVFFPKFDLLSWQLITSKEIVSSNGIHCQFKRYCRNVIHD
ncbi:MAG: dihydrofolate reductase [Burkholderiales bacterium]|nr:dihydrofolate reductase [Burkholderiales bacterium]